MSATTIEIADQLIYSYLNRRQYTNTVDVFLSESTLARWKSTSSNKETVVVESCPTVHGKNLEEIIEGFLRYAQPNIPWPFYEFATKIRALANEYSTLCDQTYSVSTFSRSSASVFPSCSQQAVPSHYDLSGTRVVGNTSNNHSFSSIHKDTKSSQSQEQQQRKPEQGRFIESADVISHDFQEATSSIGPDNCIRDLAVDHDIINGGSRRKQLHPIGRDDLMPFKTIEMIGSKLSDVVNATLHNDPSDENMHSSISQLSMSDIDTDIIDMVEDLVQYTPFPFMDDLIRTDKALANFPDPAPTMSSKFQSCSNVLNIPLATPTKSPQVHNVNSIFSKQMDPMHPLTGDFSSACKRSDNIIQNERTLPKKVPLNERPKLQNLIYHEAKNVAPVLYSAQNSGTSLNVLFGDDDDNEMDQSHSRSRSNSSVSCNTLGHIPDRSTYKESQRKDDCSDGSLKLSKDRMTSSTRVPIKEDNLDKRAAHVHTGASKQISRNQRRSRESSPAPKRHGDANRSRDIKRDQEKKRREEAMEKKHADDRKRKEELNRKRKEEETERRQRREEEKRRQYKYDLENLRLEELRKKDLEVQKTVNDDEIHRENLMDKEISRREEQERAEKRRIREEGKSFRQGANLEKKKNTHENRKRNDNMPASNTVKEIPSASVAEEIVRKNSAEEYKPTSLAVSKRTDNDIFSKIEIDLDSGWSSDPAYASLSSSQRKSSSKALRNIPRIPKRSNVNSPSDHSRSPSISGKVQETATACHSGRSSRNSSITEPCLSNGTASGTTSKIVSAKKNISMIGFWMSSWKPSDSSQCSKSSELPAGDHSFPNFSKSCGKTERDVRSYEEYVTTSNNRQPISRPTVATDFSKMLSSPMKKKEVAESNDDSNAIVANVAQRDHPAPPRKKQKIDLDMANNLLTQMHGK